MGEKRIKVYTKQNLKNTFCFDEDGKFRTIIYCAEKGDLYASLQEHEGFIDIDELISMAKSPFGMNRGVWMEREDFEKFFGDREFLEIKGEYMSQVNIGVSEKLAKKKKEEWEKKEEKERKEKMGGWDPDEWKSYSKKKG